MLTSTHVKYTDTIVLLPVTQIHLIKYVSQNTSADARVSAWLCHHAVVARASEISLTTAVASHRRLLCIATPCTHTGLAKQICKQL
jgi:hypothetical protein